MKRSLSRMLLAACVTATFLTNSVLAQIAAVTDGLEIEYNPATMDNVDIDWEAIGPDGIGGFTNVSFYELQILGAGEAPGTLNNDQSVDYAFNAAPTTSYSSVITSAWTTSETVAVGSQPDPGANQFQDDANADADWPQVVNTYHTETLGNGGLGEASPLNIDNSPATLELWVNPGNFTQQRRIIYETGGGTGLGVYQDESTLIFALAGGGNERIELDLTNVPVHGDLTASNEFIQVVVEPDQNSGNSGLGRLYVNGIFVGDTEFGGTGSVTVSNDAAGWENGDWAGGDGQSLGGRGEDNMGGRGGDFDHGGQYSAWEGDLAIARLYTKNLTQGEIAANYNSVVGTDVAADQIIDWDFTDGATSGANWDTDAEWTGGAEPTTTNNQIARIIGDGANSTTETVIVDGTGGTKTINTLMIGSENDNQGTAELQVDTGADLDVTGDLVLGLDNSDGERALVTHNGGTVDVTGDLVFGIGLENGRYDLLGGTLTVGDITRSPIGSGGTLNINGGGLAVTDPSIEVGNFILGASGSFTLDPGESVTADTITFAGTPTLNGGTLTAADVLSVAATVDASSATLDLSTAELELLSDTLTATGNLPVESVTFGGGNVDLGSGTLEVATQVDVDVATTVDTADTVLDTDMATVNLNGAELTYNGDLTVDNINFLGASADLDLTNSGPGTLTVNQEMNVDVGGGNTLAFDPTPVTGDTVLGSVDTLTLTSGEFEHQGIGVAVTNLNAEGGSIDLGGATLDVAGTLTVNQAFAPADPLDTSGATVNINAPLATSNALGADTVNFAAGGDLDTGSNVVTVDTAWNHLGGTLAIGGGQPVTGIGGAGEVNVSGGDLQFGPGGTFAYAGNTNVTAGTLNVQADLTNTPVVTVTGTGRLEGTGPLGPVVVESGGTVAPGTSVGTMVASSFTLGGGGNEEVEIAASIAPTAGTDNDLLSATGAPGTIDVTATPANGDRFTIQAVSLMPDGTTPGNISDFDPTVASSWTIATATGGVNDFNSADFDVDYTGVQNSLKDPGDLLKTPGTFSVTQSGNDINLNYAPPTASVYAQTIDNKNPLGYWRLNEHNATTEENLGSVDAADIENYVNTERVVGGLVGSDHDRATGFNGTNSDVPVVDTSINGPNTARTIEAWIQADAFGNTGGNNPSPLRHVIYGQGGGTRGLNIYVEDGTIYFHGWNNADDDGGASPDQAPWGAGNPSNDPQFVASDASAIEAGRTYHVALVYENPGVTDFDGDIRGFINGQEVGVDISGDRGAITAVGLLDNHAQPHIGANSGFQFHDDTTANGSSFDGTIDEVAVYGTPLTKESLQENFRIGTFGATPDGALADPVADNILLNYDARLDTNGNAYWDDATRHAGFDWELSGAVAGVSPMDVTGDANLPLLTKAFQYPEAQGIFEGGLSLDSVPGDPTDEDVTFELAFSASDLSDNHVLFESGGDGDGTAITLEGNNLVVHTENGANDAEITADLTGIFTADEFLHMVFSIDLTNDEISLYVNGAAVAENVAASGDLADWAGSDGAGLGIDLGALPGDPDPSPITDFDGKIGLFRLYSGLVFDQTLAQQNYDALRVIPEPSTIALALIGMLGAGIYLRRRRK